VLVARARLAQRALVVQQAQRAVELAAEPVPALAGEPVAAVPQVRLRRARPVPQAQPVRLAQQAQLVPLAQLVPAQTQADSKRLS
jgi:hypothetical protein